MTVSEQGLEFMLKAQDLTWIAGVVIIVIATLFQSLSQKVKPWTIIFGWIGKQINKATNDKLDALQSDVTDIRTEVEKIKKRNADQDEEEFEFRAIQARRRIIVAADEITNARANNIWHSKEWFRDVLKDVSFYENYVDTHPLFKNEEAVMSIEIVKDAWQHCQDTNSFLVNPRVMGVQSGATG